MRAPDLDDLAAFAAIARRRSFRAAAVERGVSVSTLSQTLRDLEARLDLRLINRTTRSVALTEAGARLLERITPALADISRAVEETLTEAGEATGRLRINAPEPAIELTLAPMIAPFLAANPRVELEIRAETALVDIVAEGFDAGVRWGESLAKDMIAVPISGPQRYVVIAAPELLARVGTPSHPRDLLAAPCIRTRFASGLTPAWEFERGGETVRIEPSGPLVGASAHSLIRACCDGVGFYTTFEDFARPHLQAGRLVTVLDDWCEPFPGPFLYYPSRRHMPGPLRAFVDFARWRG
ncbi:LysR family transcriptional regulator [Phenylobacterium aquaticum]|uniref:LysR family transcriptional regulator n=1 Tax=Phenylobacterium aquaticum TaxID=1763816 RepID=UPI001F5D4A00|nr:LysR family transcriptional regulator [Phenylobacterium aquaticum]MCI3133967.1 LysR family transcriptional regulator [Phenylobacterium aquaticum]